MKKFLLLFLLTTIAHAECVPPPTDFDGSGSVTAADYARIIPWVNTTARQADFNCSGLVTATDVWILVKAIGTAPKLSGLRPINMGVVVNTDDPESEAIAAYYMRERSIPESNLVRVKLGNTEAVNVPFFEAERAKVIAAIGPNVQALALAFSHPVKVHYTNSITSAFAHGFWTRGVSSGETGWVNPLYTSQRSDYRVSGTIPTMMLPGPLESAKALIDRGVASDRTAPKEPFVCLITTDPTRGGRCVNEPSPPLTIVRANSHPGPAIAYFQGLAIIPSFPVFVPGAWSDNLTSAGGIEGGGQTTVWEAIALGATGSYGTIEEPYAMLGKFPRPITFTNEYKSGVTLVEAVYRSIRFPYQGLVVGEPLANPWQHPL